MNYKYANILWLGLLLLVTACVGSAEKPPYPGIKLGKPYEIYGRWYKPHYDKDYDEIGMASWYGPGFHGGKTASGERFDENDLTAAHRTLPLPSIVRVTNLNNGRSIILKINDRGPYARDRIIDLSKGSAIKLGIKGTAKVRVQFLDQETREYVQNLRNGTQYAMNSIKNVDPAAAAQREEARQAQLVAQQAHTTPPAAPSDEATEGQPDIFSVADNATPAPVASSYIMPGSPAIRSFAQPPASRAYNQSFFVQAGTFGMKENADRMLEKLNSTGSAQIMEIMTNKKKFYRVMIGPYNIQDDARNVLSKLASLGISDAKIIRN